MLTLQVLWHLPIGVGCFLLFFNAVLFWEDGQEFVRSVHVMCSDMLIDAAVFILVWDANHLQICYGC